MRKPTLTDIAYKKKTSVKKTAHTGKFKKKRTQGVLTICRKNPVGVTVA